MILQIMFAIAWYSASTNDLETMGYFLDFQEMRDEPRKIYKPNMERLVSKHVAQSEYAKAFDCNSELDEKKKKRP